MTERRRGAALERALLDAAWEELAESGYGDLTMEAVAARAGTSRAVLYRRWTDKAQLVEAAFAAVARRHMPEIPDTGGLRGDLLSVMRQANAAPALVATPMMLNVRSYFQATGNTPEQLRERLGLEGDGVLQTVCERAVRRGEMAPEALVRRIRDLPLLLLREEILGNAGPVEDAVLQEILDVVCLPLMRGPKG